MQARRSFLASYINAVTGKKGRWLTVLVWITAALLLNLAFPQANTKVNNSADNFDSGKPSVQAAAIAAEQYPSASGLPALIVWRNDAGLGTEDLQKIQAVTKQVFENPLPDQVMVPPLHQLPLEVLGRQASEDGTTLILPLFFNEEAEAEVLRANVKQLMQTTTNIVGMNPFASVLDSSGLTARVTGPAGIVMDATQLFAAGDVSLTIVTFVLVLGVLLLIYRSPILSMIPLVGVGAAYAVISPILGWMGQEGWITFDSQGLSIMTVLLFGAGTDYCLFLISRFRQYLKTEESKLKALGKSISDKGGPIAMSALTTVFALIFLLLADYGPIQRFSIPFVIAITFAGLSSLTFVPALLAILGRASFFPFVPMTEEMLVERAKAKGKPMAKKPAKTLLGVRLSHFVVDHAKSVTIASTIVLVLLAAVAAQMKFTYDTLSSFPEEMASREGFQLIEQAFNPGQLAPVKIIADTEGNPVALKERLEKLSYAAKVSEPEQGKVNNHLMMVEVELTMNPYSNEAMDVIPELKRAAEEALIEAGAAEVSGKTWIAGQTAEQYDIRETSSRDAMLLVPIILVVIAALVMLYLRSVTAMLYLMATVVVSYFSALGLGWIVIHYVLGAEAVQGFIPLYAFIFLGALGIDYNLFLKSSIWKKAKVMPLNQAIKEGTAETGGVISSAGTILAGTFAVLATLPIQILVHFGIITALGVLIDTFLVRPFLVPAINAWLGKKAFWPGAYKPVRSETSSSA